jgi:hypothetical protein
VDHLSEQIIDQHHQRKLSSEQLLAVDEHLQQCAQCHRLWSMKKANVNEQAAALQGQLFGSQVFADQHLTYESLEALVDNAASEVDREIAQVHLEDCSQCAAELSALEELRDQKTPIISQEQPTTRSLFSWAGWPKLAFAAAAGVLLAAILWIVWKSQQSPIETNNTSVAVSATPSPAIVSSPVPTPSISPSPEALVSLRDGGGTVTLDSTGNLSGPDNLSPALAEAIRRALTTEQLNIGPAIAGLRSKGGTLMGNENQGTPFRLFTPVGVVVQSDRPTFRWEPYEGATSYVAKVYDSDFKELAASLSQTGTSWTIPLPLPRGATYTWQVTAMKSGEEIKSPSAPAAPPRFRILAQDRLNEIRRAQRITPRSHLALGMLYAEAGLLDDARREFRLLLKANPGSRVVQKLLQEVNVQ